MTPDPIGLGGGINLFAYTSNNPINYIDPKGLFCGQACDNVHIDNSCPPGFQRFGNECWPMDNKDYPCGAGFVDDGVGSCVEVWPPKRKGLYCGIISRTISVCADATSIGSVAATALSGGTASPATAIAGASARLISAANGVATFLICGPSPSTITSTFGSAAPGWWGAAVSALDAALASAGY